MTAQKIWPGKHIKSTRQFYCMRLLQRQTCYSVSLLYRSQHHTDKSSASTISVSEEAKTIPSIQQNLKEHPDNVNSNGFVNLNIPEIEIYQAPIHSISVLDALLTYRARFSKELSKQHL